MDVGLSIACLQHAPFEGPAAIEDWARKRLHRLSVTRLDLGDRLPVPEQFDWLVVLGGPMGVGDEAQHPWLAAERDLIREAIAAGRTVLGICLGAQVIASVLGASVARAEEREIGWFPVRLTPQARALPWLDALPDSFTAFHWHTDTFTLPEGATRLASSEGCREQAFLFGSSVLAVQFHLEMTEASIAALIEHCGRDLRPGRFVQDLAALREDTRRHLGEAHRLLDLALDTLPGSGTFLTTARLRLRRMRPRDAERIVRLDSDPEVKRWIDRGRPPDADRIREEVMPKWLAMYERTGGLGFFAAEERQTGEFLGWFHLKPWTGADDGEALELGYRLHRHRWGLGLATEGSRALIEVAFREFGARRVVARAMAANSSSLRVLEKCGLLFSHDYEEDRFPGEDRTAVIYDLAAEDYEGPEAEY